MHEHGRRGGKRTRSFFPRGRAITTFCNPGKGGRWEGERGLVGNARQRLWNLISSPKPPSLSSLLARNSCFTPSLPSSLPPLGILPKLTLLPLSLAPFAPSSAIWLTLRRVRIAKFFHGGCKRGMRRLRRHECSYFLLRPHDKMSQNTLERKGMLAQGILIK